MFPSVIGWGVGGGGGWGKEAPVRRQVLLAPDHRYNEVKVTASDWQGDQPILPGHLGGGWGSSRPSPHGRDQQASDRCRVSWKRIHGVREASAEPYVC